MTTQNRTTTRSETISVDGRDRRYLITRPTDAPLPAPLVLVLHGSLQSPEQIRSMTEPGFDSLASTDGAIVVYPEGYEKHWNDARISTTFSARSENIDDVAFLRAVVAELVNSGEVDAKRVFAVGYSLGGQMVNRLAHEDSGTLAAVAMIGAAQPVEENFRPAVDHRRPLPVLLVHGTKDPNVPYDGGMASLRGFRPRGLGLSAPETARYWAGRNGHDLGITAPSALVSGPRRAKEPTSLDRTDFRTEGKPPVTLFTVEGGGHQIPGLKRGPWIMGRTSPLLLTVNEIARFFGLRDTGEPDSASS